MTGAYLRVMRDEKWHNIEVEHLTKTERRAIFASRPVEEILNWLDMCCELIASAEEEMP